MNEDQESPGFNVTVALAGNAIDVLEQLFIKGPTWDGNIVSKSGRDSLFDLKLATRVEGYSFLTQEGAKLALQNGIARKNEKRERALSSEIDKFRRIAEIVSPPVNECQKSVAPPTVQGLEALLKPEPLAMTFASSDATVDRGTEHAIR